MLHVLQRPLLQHRLQHEGVEPYRGSPRGAAVLHGVALHGVALQVALRAAALKGAGWAALAQLALKGAGHSRPPSYVVPVALSRVRRETWRG